MIRTHAMSLLLLLHKRTAAVKLAKRVDASSGIAGHVKASVWSIPVKWWPVPKKFSNHHNSSL